MKAIEFEAIAVNHTIQLPNTIPDGVKLRVCVQHDAVPAKESLKALLASVTEGLSDDDLARPRDFGRE